MSRWVYLLAAAGVLAGQTSPPTKKRTAPPKKVAPAPQTAPAPAAPSVFPIESIRVEGSKNYTSEELVPVTGLKAGQPGDDKAFEEARMRLVETGVFATAGYEYAAAQAGGGYAVRFLVTDFEEKYPVRFARMGKPDAELRSRARSHVPLFRDPLPASKPLIEGVRKALADAVGVPVEMRITSDRPGELYMLFYPAGAPPVIAEVRFRGNRVLPAAALQNAIQGVSVGVEWREELFREQLKASVVPLYEARGRVRVRFPKLEVAPAEKVKGLTVTVEVEEGPSYSLREIEITGVPEPGARDIGKQANLKPGDVANFDEVKAGQDRIHHALRRGGFMQVNSKVERKIDDEKKAVDIEIVVTPGPQYKFGRLFLKGLDIIGEAEIKKMWGMDPGKPFNAEYPDFFLERVKEEKIFENLGKTKAILTPHHEALSVDVTLVFG